MFYVLALVSGFASFWFLVAALQTFDAAGPARPTNVILAVVTALLTVAFIWAGRRWKVLLLVALALAPGALALAPAARPAAAAGEQVVVSTNPPLGQVHPHGGPSAGIQPDTVILEVKDASGRDVHDVLLDVQMDAPPTNWFISTDVPRIEGHTVLNWSAVAPTGRQEFAYLFPIRGTYHLTVKASPAPGSAAPFTPFTQDLTLDVSEKPTSILYLTLFLAVLLLFGAVSGFVLGRSNLAARGAARG
jgi:hypothetical protein